MAALGKLRRGAARVVETNASWGALQDAIMISEDTAMKNVAEAFAKAQGKTNESVEERCGAAARSLLLLLPDASLTMADSVKALLAGLARGVADDITTLAQADQASAKAVRRFHESRLQVEKISPHLGEAPCNLGCVLLCCAGLLRRKIRFCSVLVGAHL
jgi:hypothetical protein